MDANIQALGEAELGFVLGVPCVIVNPDKQTEFYLTYKTVALTCKKLNVEIDRYNIDPNPKNNSNEQYLKSRIIGTNV